MAAAITTRSDYGTENARRLCYRLMPEKWRALRLVLCLEFGERSAYYYYTPHPRKHHRTQHPPAFPAFSGTRSEASEGFFRNPRRGTPDVGVGWVFDPHSNGWPLRAQHSPVRYGFLPHRGSPLTKTLGTATMNTNHRGGWSGPWRFGGVAAIGRHPLLKTPSAFVPNPAPG